MAKFSKQDYVGIANVIDGVWRRLTNESRWSHRVVVEIMGETVTAFADMFEQDNPRFDRQRFVMACEGHDESGGES